MIATTFVGALSGNATTAGTVITAAQPNITSVGTLTGLLMGGNITPNVTNTYSLGNSTNRWDNLWLAGNTIYLGNADVKANATALVLTNPIGGQLVVSGTGVASSNNIYNGNSNVNIATANGNVTIAAVGNTTMTITGTGANITGTANVSGNLTTGAELSVTGNALITGNLTVNGNLTYINTETLAVEDPIINLQTGPNGAAPTSNSGKDVGTALNYYDTTARIAFMGWDVSNAEFGMASVATIASEVVTFSTYGNLRVGNIIGNGQSLTGLAGGNITGQVANALVAGTVYTNAQPNITSVGTLTSLGVNGTVTAVAFTANTGVFTGNGNGLSSIVGANVTGTVASATAATNASALLQNTSTATSVFPTFSTSSANGNSSAVVSTGISANLGNSSITATTFVGALSGNATTAGTVITAAQPNITSVGTLTGLTIGNATANSVFGNGTITLNSGLITGNGNGLSSLQAANVTGTLPTSVTNAISNVGTITAGTWNSTFTAGLNANTLANIQGANVSGAVASATAATNASALLQNTSTATSVFPTFSTSSANGNSSAVVSTGISANLGNSSITATTFVGALSGNATTAGTVVTAAQPNITSVGTLTSLGVSGSVTASTLVSNVAIGTAPLTVTSTTKVTNLNADLLDGYDSASTATAATIALRTGDGSIIANMFYGAGNNLSNIQGANVSGAVASATAATNASALLQNTSASTTAWPTFTTSSANGNSQAVFNTGISANLGNSSITATTFVGALSGNATTAGTVITAAQSNITSVGTLTTLGVNGTVTAVAFTANTGVFTGNGNGLSSIVGANVTGTVASATAATNASALLQNTSTATSVFPTFTSSSANGNSSAVINTGISANLGNASITATTFVGALSGNATTAGTVVTAAQPNITSTGTLSSLTVTANVAAGNLTTGGVLTVTGTGVSSIAGNLDMTSNTIINLATPTNASDAATKQYVDDVAQGLHTHDSCNAATQTTLASISGGTITYNNGASGVGANLTVTGGTTNFTVIDGVTLSDGMRILVKNEANTAHNGIYDRTSSTVLTRSDDFNTPVEMAGGDFTFVTAGTLYDNTGWVMPDAVTTVGTSPVVWIQFSGAGTYTAGAGLTLTGSQFSVNVAQPGITSVGTLTSLGVNGTVTAVAFTANTGVFTGNGNGLSSIVGSNVTGTVASATAATNASALLQNTSASTTAWPTFTTSSANGNSQAVFNTGISANLGNSSITATTFVGALSGNATTAGTVVTAAQSNITSVGTLTSLGVNGTVTAVAFTANTGVFTGNGNGLSSIVGANVTGTVASATAATNASALLQNTSTATSVFPTFTTSSANGNSSAVINTGISANLGNASITATTFVGALSGNATTAGTVITAAQPNITSVGTLTSLGVSGAVTASTLTSNVATGTAPFTVTSTTRVANLNVATAGSADSATAATNAAALLQNTSAATTVYPTFTTSSANGNSQAVFNTGISANLGNTSITATTFVGALSGNATTAGTVITAAQPNITSVGTLTSLGVSGAVTASTLTSNVATGTAPFTVTSTTRVANLNVATAGTADSATSATNAAALLQNTSTATTVYPTFSTSSANGNSQAVINTGISANLANASITATTFVGSLSGAATSATSATNAAALLQNTSTSTTVYPTFTTSSANGNSQAVFNTSISANLGNASITATTFVGALSGTATSATTATTAGTVTTAAQPNITSVGLLANLNAGAITVNGTTGLPVQVSGQPILTGSLGSPNIGALYIGDGSGWNFKFRTRTGSTDTDRVTFFDNGNVTLNTGVITGNGSGLSAIAAANVTGQVANALVAGTVYTAAQPNITSVGTLTGLTSSGAVSITNSTAATSRTTGALIVTGGIGASANSFFTNLNVASNIAYVAPNGANTINSTMLNGGTLAWSGNAGQLFSIADNMTGNIFTVNDVSGIPMISVDAGGNIQFAASGGFVNYGVTSGITAAGSTQGTATALTRPINVVSTVSASTGVILPTVPAGARIIIMNTSGTALNVYPPSGAAINSGSTNAAYSMPAGVRLEYISTSSTQWYTMNATYG